MYVIIVKSLSSFNVRNFVLFVNFKQGMKSFFFEENRFLAESTASHRHVH